MLECRGRRIFLGIILIVTMVISGMQTVAYANPENTGEVTEIKTAEDLMKFAEDVNGGDDYKGKTVRLTANIDLSEAGDWTPIGTQNNPFKGTFDGQGHTVSGYKLDGTALDNGLFGCIDGGTIEDVTISDVDIALTAEQSGKDWTFGVLAGSVKGATLSKITIKDVTINATVNSAKHALIGGVAGAVDCITSGSASTDVSKCIVKDLSVKYGGAADEHISIGGIAGGVGKISSDGSYKKVNVDISGCDVTSFSVNRSSEGKSSNYEMIGGISGYTNSEGTIENCHSVKLSYNIKAVVQVPKNSARDGYKIFGIYGGGIAGSVDGGMEIISCTSEGKMIADIEGGYETNTSYKDKTIQGGFFGGIVGLIGSMPELSGWGASYIGDGATIDSCFANISFTAEDNESMRHASALRAVGEGATIKIENYFTLCSFNGEVYDEGLDYNYGFPLLGPGVPPRFAGNVTQSDNNIFLLIPKVMEVWKEGVPAVYIGFTNNSIRNDELESPENFEKVFIGESGSATYKSENAIPEEGGSELTFTNKGIQYVDAEITNNESETIKFTFPVKVVGPTQFTITAEADEHGKIEPAGSVTVDKDGKKEFKVTPDEGYKIKDVIVDNNSVGTNSSYTFENVTNNHTIKAEFEPEEYQIVYKGLEDVTVQPANPEQYTIETESFTLNNPERSGYTFAGWTGTGLTEPTMTVTIEKGSMGNREYTATWIKNSTPGGNSGGGSGSIRVTTDRIGGENRFETAVKVAERLKSKLGVSKFDTIIVADSDDFADALSAAPLASEKDAPILVVNERSEKYVKDYIDAHISANGKVYIIGETAAVSEGFEKSLASHKVTRLGGADRYETNLKVLKELNLKGESEIMVASGRDYPDALSASATGKPILLVKDSIFDYQKEYLKTLGGDDDYFVIGGTAAVNEKIADQLEGFDQDGVSRVWGDDRFGTAEAVANRFFRNARVVYIASGCDFPDSLVGGVIAHKNNAPLLLVSERNYSEAARFVDSHSVRRVTAIGGPAAVSDKVLCAVAR